jgi:hypothetical protein
MIELHMKRKYELREKLIPNTYHIRSASFHGSQTSENYEMQLLYSARSATLELDHSRSSELDAGQPGQGHQNFLLPITYKPALSPYQPVLQWELRVFWNKAAGREANYPPPSSSEVKNG